MIQINFTKDEYEASGLKLAIESVYTAAKSLYPELGGIDLSLIDNQTIQQVNRDTAENDYVTDVLSFAYPEVRRVFDHEPMGEILIAYEVALSQSKTKNHSLNYEVAYLLVHGLLHVLGYDHQDDTEKRDMDVRTEKVIEEAKVSKN